MTVGEALQVSLKQAICSTLDVSDFSKYDITKEVDWLDALDIDTEYSREIGKRVYCGNASIEAFLRSRHV